MGGFICPHCRKYTADDEPRCIHCGGYVGSRWLADLLRFFGGDLIVTKVIIAVCVVVFGVELVFSGGAQGGVVMWLDSEALLRAGAFSNEAPRWWQYFSGGLVHIGALHLLMNMAAAWQLGGELEPIIGRSRLLFSFVATSLVGFFLISRFGLGAITAGASAGLFGWDAILIMYRRARSQSFWSAVKPQLWQIIVLTLIGSFWGHLGGAMAGWVLGLYFKREWRPYRHDVVLGVAGVAGLLVACAAVGHSALTYAPPPGEVAVYEAPDDTPSSTLGFEQACPAWTRGECASDGALYVALAPLHPRADAALVSARVICRDGIFWRMRTAPVPGPVNPCDDNPGCPLVEEKEGLVLIHARRWTTEAAGWVSDWVMRAERTDDVSHLFTKRMRVTRFTDACGSRIALSLDEVLGP